ncbi:MAG: hypothetical protein ACRC28_06205 [Clostridium sp.]|uniref:hypothetical protein n=1 Tax=Clostridia TaxID=186801 RepID=UPI003F2BFEBB
MMNLNNIQSEIFKLVPNAYDRLPEDFDFGNDLGIQIDIGESISDKYYCDEISMKVTITGLIENKMEIQSKTLELDKILNKTIINNDLMIIRENVWLSNYYDKDTFNNVLLYTIKIY